MHLLAIGLSLAASSGAETTRAATQRAPLPRLDSGVSALAPDDCRLAIAAPPTCTLVLDVSTGEVEAQHECAFGSAVAIAWRADGAEWAVLDEGGGLCVYDTATQRPLLQTRCSAERPGGEYDLRVLEYLSASSSLIVGFGSRVEVLDTLSGTSGLRLEFEAEASPSAVAASKCGGLVAIGDRTGEVSVWSTRTSEGVRGPFQFPRGKWNFGIHALAFHPNGRSLAVGAGDCEARIWRFDEGDRVVTFSHRDVDMFDQTAIGDVQFSPDGLRFVSQSFEWREVRIWDVGSGRLLGSYDYAGGNSRRMRSRFTDDGRYVISELAGIVIDAKRGTVSHQLRPVRHLGPMYNFSGQRAWTAVDSVLRVHDIASGTMILEREMQP